MPLAPTADLPIRVVVASESLAFMDTYVAKGANVFPGVGLKVTWQPAIPAAAQALAAVANGDSDVANVATLYAIPAAASNPAVKLFAGGAIGVTSLIFVRKAIAAAIAKQGVTPRSSITDRLRALKGLTIGAGSAGGATELNVRVALQSVGLDPDVDVTLVSGMSDSQLAAFNAGQIDASAQGVLYALQPVLEGTGVIWISGPDGDVPEWNKGYFLCWATSETFASSHPEALQRFIAGLRVASGIIERDRVGSLRALKATFTDLNPALLSSAFDAQRKAYVTEPSVKKSVLLDVINLYNATSSKPVSVTPEQIVARGFLRT